MRVNLTSADDKLYYAEYGNFNIESEEEGYRFHISNFRITSSEGEHIVYYKREYILKQDRQVSYLICFVMLISINTFQLVC